MAKENKVMEIKDGVNTKQKEMERANMEDTQIALNDTEEMDTEEVMKILPRNEYTNLPFEEQIELMKYYREHYTVQQIKKEMGLSTSNYYRLLKKLGIHDQIARPLSQPRAKQTKAQTKEITFDFVQNGVKFQGDLNLESLLEKVEGFINFGGGNEGDFEFTFEMTRK